MSRRGRTALVLASAMTLGTMPAGVGLAAEGDVDPVRMIEAMEAAFGVTPGHRRNHIKGTCAVGEFVGQASARRYSRSPLFSGEAIPVIGRFSLGGGNPGASDADKGVRGMALQFQLPGGGLQQMAMINVPVFGAAEPKTFHDMLVALQPDPATGKRDPERFRAFVDSHPDFHGLAEYNSRHNPPPSYADSRYFSLHAFRFVNGDGEKTLVRWYFQPRDGVKELSDAEREAAPDDFLESELIGRTEKAPVEWDMVIRIGQPGDPDTDPSKPWPEDREEVKVGVLTLTDAMPQEQGQCGPINFDPLVIADGIEATDDPVLKARSAAYAISFGKRISEQ
ncbi:catalase family peroxidase [Marinobacterium aestuariivivens]|uniref:Catalase-related peroxidase n=1 Tax=Marinobacterium aestuariivivens TaxID=1698799 RepID=A0ABW2A2F5_9GAMM